MSSGRCTNDRADPVDAGVERGVEVGAILGGHRRETEIVVSGRLTPLRAVSRPADLDAGGAPARHWSRPR